MTAGPPALPARCRTALFLAAALLPFAVTRARAVTADAGEDRTLSARADCTARAVLDAGASELEANETAEYSWTGNFPEGNGVISGERVTVTLDRGVHTITLRARGSSGSTSTDSVRITVVDDDPPQIRSVRPSVSELWPPDHRWVPVTLDVDASDNCDGAPECELVSITSDESENGTGDGNTAPDHEITGRFSARLRAERAGPGNGRVYTLRVRCEDSEGNEASRTTQIFVPHDQGGHGEKPGAPDPQFTEPAARLSLRVNFQTLRKNRFTARVDNAALESAVPENDTKKRKDDLAGYVLEARVGEARLSATFDAKGRAVSDAMRARWRPAKNRIQLDLRGVDLPAALDLDPRLHGKHIAVDVPLRIVLRPPESAPGETLVLINDAVPSEYSSKAPKGGGH
jgi:hypothetical protein